MKRPTRVEHFRWLGDKRNQRVYDLDAVSDESVFDELVASEQYLVLGLILSLKRVTAAIGKEKFR